MTCLILKFTIKIIHNSNNTIIFNFVELQDLKISINSSGTQKLPIASF